MKSQRQLQIGENIKRVMSEIFMKDDILSVPGSYITILEADVSPDAKNVKIFIDIFGNKDMHDKIIEKLNEAQSHFRHELAQKIALKSIPQIRFILDNTTDKARNIEDLIAQEAKNFKG